METEVVVRFDTLDGVGDLDTFTHSVGGARTRRTLIWYFGLSDSSMVNFTHLIASGMLRLGSFVLNRAAF